MRTSRLKVLTFALTLAAVQSTWAGVTQCATAAAGNPLDTAGYTPTSLANGCAEIDVSFTNLGLTGGASTGGGTTPSTANIDIYSTGTAASGNAVGPVNFFVDGFASISSGGASSETGTVSVQADANTGGTFTGGTYPTPANSTHWQYSSLELLPTASAVGTGDTITITETICLNATSTTSGTGGCEAADLGTLKATFTGSTTPVYVCSATFVTLGVCTASSNTLSFTNLTQPTLIAATELVSVVRAAGTTVTLTNIEDIFGEDAVPEPSTFFLLGASLAGLGLLRLRNRRTKSAGAVQ